MFTLSGLILGTRQNIFRDFWSLFSISFYFSSERNLLKKTRNRLWAVLGQDSLAGAFIRRARGPSRASPPRRLTLAPAAAARRRRRRSCAPPEVRRRLVFRAVLKKSSFFFFIGFFRGYFLIAISDPIFVLV